MLADIPDTLFVFFVSFVVLAESAVDLSFGTHDLCRGRRFTIHCRLGIEHPDAAPGFDKFNRQAQLIPGFDRLFETCFIDTYQIVEGIAFCTAISRSERQQAGRLRQCLQDQHTRHNRLAGEMALKKWFVDSNIFNAHQRLSFMEFHHPVDKQKRITVRQQILNFENIHGLILNLIPRFRIALYFISLLSR